MIRGESSQIRFSEGTAECYLFGASLRRAVAWSAGALWTIRDGLRPVLSLAPRSSRVPGSIDRIPPIGFIAEPRSHLGDGEPLVEGRIEWGSGTFPEIPR